MNELMRNKDNYLEKYIIENATNASALGNYTRHMVEIAEESLINESDQYPHKVNKK